MNISNLTITVLVCALVSLIGYDIYAVIQGGTHATISWTLWTYSHQYPILPLGAGIILGHLFWSQTT